MGSSFKNILQQCINDLDMKDETEEPAYVEISKNYLKYSNKNDQLFNHLPRYHHKSSHLPHNQSIICKMYPFR